MALTVGAVSVEIVQGGHQVVQEPLAESGRGLSGTLLSAVTSGRGHARTWRFQSAVMTAADVALLEAELNTVGGITIDGALVGGSSLTCHPRNIRRTYPRQYTGFAQVSFDLLESEP